MQKHLPQHRERDTDMDQLEPLRSIVDSIVCQLDASGPAPATRDVMNGNRICARYANDRVLATNDVHLMLRSRDFRPKTLETEK